MDRSGLLPQVEISGRAAGRLRSGYLWIFSNEVNMRQELPAPGAWCHFHAGHRVVGTGYFNPHSLIAGRILASEEHGDISALLADRLRTAFEKRRTLVERGPARLVYSESDSLPGLILDLYGKTAVLQSSTAGMDAVLDDLKRLVPEICQSLYGESLEALVIRADSPMRRREGVPGYTSIAFGDQEALREGVVEENGVRYAADFLKGQKTGFYLDQRDNRAFLRHWVAGHGAARVLDLCCYSGGWGIQALAGGAQHVTFVEESREAVLLLERGLELNHLGPQRREIAQAEVFGFLTKTRDTYDIVVADPPAFVKSKKDLPQAKKAYEKLNRLAWRRLIPGGWLFTSSCSYHLREQEFLEVLAAAVAKEKGRAHLAYRGTQSLSDHPVLLSMPETNYLKCVGLRKLS